MALYPAGQDMAVRWIIAALSCVVVVTVLVAVAMLINPGEKQTVRRGPVEALNAVIDNRP